MHDGHHERVLHHDVDRTAEDHSEGEEYSLAPRHGALPLVVGEETAHVARPGAVEHGAL